MVLRHSFLVLTALVLSGCAASGELYGEISQSSKIASPSSGRLTFFRPAGTFAGAGRDVFVTVNDGSGKYVATGGFVIIDMPAGDYTVNAALNPDYFKCELPVSVKPLEEQFFEIVPNTGRILNAALTAGIVTANHIRGYQSYVISPKSKPNCQGFFIAAPVEREYALKHLAVIRESRQ